MKTIYSSLLLIVYAVLMVGCSAQVELEKNESIKDVSINNQYLLVDSWQKNVYDNDGDIITPAVWDEFFGQDAHYEWVDFSFSSNWDWTVSDNNTNLMRQIVPSNDKYSWNEALDYASSSDLAWYSDWRLPTAKELFSLSDFQTWRPYLNEEYFEFPKEEQWWRPEWWSPWWAPQGNANNDSEQKDLVDDMPPPSSGDDASASKAIWQFWSSNFYFVWTAHWWINTAFGVNHVTGHIKWYPSDVTWQMGKYVRLVRGDVYGVNRFVDNQDETVTDQATNLMWMKNDSWTAVERKDALAYCEDLTLAWYDDYKLPDVKELQSILDYSWVYPAIDLAFFVTTELSENINYYFWTNTSAYFSPTDPVYGYAWYVAFGKAVWNDWEDSHWAWAVRFSPKYDWSELAWEWWDNIYNSVRCVRKI